MRGISIPIRFFDCMDLYGFYRDFIRGHLLFFAFVAILFIYRVFGL